MKRFSGKSWIQSIRFCREIVKVDTIAFSVLQTDGVLFLPYMVFEPELVPVINAHLPHKIRVIALMRATKSFDSRHNCSGRSYEYLVPTYAFAPFRLTALDYRIDGVLGLFL